MEENVENSENLDKAYLKGSIIPAHVVSSIRTSSKHLDMGHKGKDWTPWTHPLHQVLEAGNIPYSSGGELPCQDRETKHHQRPDSIILNNMVERSHQNLLNQLPEDVPQEQVSHQVPQHQLHEQA